MKKVYMGKLPGGLDSIVDGCLILLPILNAAVQCETETGRLLLIVEGLKGIEQKYTKRVLLAENLLSQISERESVEKIVFEYNNYELEVEENSYLESVRDQMKR